ncbi:winged helix-turn-helix domain-containing protein [Thermococcus prieurii]
MGNGTRSVQYDGYVCAHNKTTINKTGRVCDDKLAGGGHVLLFGHHSRIDLIYTTTYIYNVLQFLGDRLYDYFVKNKYQAENFINNVEDWEHVGERRVRGRKYFVFRNLKYGLEFYVRPSWVDDAPIVIRFGDATVTVRLIYRNTSDATVVYESAPRVVVQVDLHGDLEFVRFLDILSRLGNRDIDFSEGLLKVRFVKFEVYVRYSRRNLKKVERALLGLRDRIGVGFELRDKLKFRYQYWLVVDAVYAGILFKIKSYLTHKYPDRDPKLEIVIPLGIELRGFHDIEGLREVKRKVDFAQAFLASFVVALDLELAPSEEDSKFRSYSVVPNEQYVAFILGSGLSYELEHLILDDPRLDDIDRVILRELANRNLTSSDLRKIATLVGRALSTVQFRMRRLKGWGYVDYDRKGRRRQYVYWLNLEKFVSSGQGEFASDWERYIDPAFREVVSRRVVDSADRELSRKLLRELVLVLWLIYKGVDRRSAIQAVLPKFGVSVGKRAVQNWISQLVGWGLIKPLGNGRRRRYAINFEL